MGIGAGPFERIDYGRANAGHLSKLREYVVQSTNTVRRFVVILPAGRDVSAVDRFARVNCARG